MNGIAPHIAREVEVDALGRRWKFPRMSVDVIDKFLDWVKPQLPDPFAGLDKILDKVPAELATKLIREAQEKAEAPLDWGSPVVQKYQQTGRGGTYFILIMLQVHQPETTIGDVYALMEELGPDRIDRIVEDISGQQPSVAKKKDRAASPRQPAALTGNGSSGS